MNISLPLVMMKGVTHYTRGMDACVHVGTSPLEERPTTSILWEASEPFRGGRVHRGGATKRVAANYRSRKGAPQSGGDDKGGNNTTNVTGAVTELQESVTGHLGYGTDQRAEPQEGRHACWQGRCRTWADSRLDPVAVFITGEYWIASLKMSSTTRSICWDRETATTLSGQNGDQRLAKRREKATTLSGQNGDQRLVKRLTLIALAFSP